MKSKIFVLSLFSLLTITNITYSQGEAAVPFLLLQPSPSLAAMGQTGMILKIFAASLKVLTLSNAKNFIN